MVSDQAQGCLLKRAAPRAPRDAQRHDDNRWLHMVGGHPVQAWARERQYRC
jgi:hypothetical protein